MISPEAAELLQKLSEIRVRIRTKVLRAGQPVAAADIISRTVGLMVVDPDGTLTLRTVASKDYDNIAQVVEIVKRDFVPELNELRGLIKGRITGPLVKFAASPGEIVSVSTPTQFTGGAPNVTIINNAPNVDVKWVAGKIVQKYTLSRKLLCFNKIGPLTPPTSTLVRLPWVCCKT